MAVCFITSALPASSHADTSYLLIQGDFGSGGTEENFKWQVNYQTGDLSTGQDLLNAVFGQPVLMGSYTDGLGDPPYDEYQAGSGSQSANYIDFGTGLGLFPISFTLGGTTILQDPTYSPGWIYYAAGGSGAYGPDDDGDGAEYPNTGTWTPSNFCNDGLSQRTLADGSYDGWVFGNPYNPDMIDDSSGAAGPNSTEFPVTNSTNFFTILNIPEPGAPVLLGATLAALAIWKRKARG
jgi:hypothetical protein